MSRWSGCLGAGFGEGEPLIAEVGNDLQPELAAPDGLAAAATRSSSYGGQKGVACEALLRTQAAAGAISRDEAAGAGDFSLRHVPSSSPGQLPKYPVPAAIADPPLMGWQPAPRTARRD